MLEESMKGIRELQLKEEAMEISLNNTLVSLMDAWDLNHVEAIHNINGKTVTTSIYKGDHK